MNNKQDQSVFIAGCCMPGVWIKDVGYSSFIYNQDNLAVFNLNLEDITSVARILDLEKYLQTYPNLYSTKVNISKKIATVSWDISCLLYTSPSPRDS